jgi:DNA topoisomerase-1
MAKSLVIVESPAKARTIGHYLGGQYVVRASMGHVRDLPEDEFGVDVEHGFAPTYEVMPDKKKVVTPLRKAAKSADAVYLATDLDREGEAIAWHLCYALDVPPEKAFRVTFNQITAPAVRAAFTQPGRVNQAKVDAQQARRILDRIVGYELSPLLWRLVMKGLSAGRVQSVAVRLVVERERAIAAFVPEEFWKITATLASKPAEKGTFLISAEHPSGKMGSDPNEKTSRGQTPFSPSGASHRGLPTPFPASPSFVAELIEWRGEKFKAATGAAAHAVVDALKNASYTVAALKVDRRSENPPPPFITSTLQQTAAVQLRLSTRNTMRIAQQLYEGLPIGDEGEVGLITYMRTDSVNIAGEALAACRAFIGGAFGADYLPESARRFKSRAGAQEAHEAIRPTDVTRTPERVRPFLDEQQARLYDLIWRRFVASQMAAASYENTSARIAAGEGVFLAKGRRLLFDGFRRVAGLASTEDQLLPPLAERQSLDLLKLDPSQHFTEPPPRYSEATLIQALEREGIGRPSTYAPIVSTIQDRHYVELIKRRFHATELGMLVTDLLVKKFERIMDVGFTRHMESELDRIEEQGADWVAVLREFYEPFRSALAAAAGLTPDQKCPECGKPLTVKRGRFGSYVACTGAPACKYKATIGRETPQETLDQACPECGKPLAVKFSRFGKFIGCTGYPDCKYTQRLNGPAEAEHLDEPCPDCGKPLAIRNSRYGKFIACTGYPDCKYKRKMQRGARTESAESPPGGARNAITGAGSAAPISGLRAPPAAPPAAEAEGPPSLGRNGQDGGATGAAPAKSERQARAEAVFAAAQQSVKEHAAGSAPSDAPADLPACKECGAPMVLRKSRRGPFLGCSTYPKCKGTQRLPAEFKAPPPTPVEGVTCPACGGPMVQRKSRHGPFLGCANYPKCKGTRRLDEAPPSGGSAPVSTTDSTQAPPLAAGVEAPAPAPAPRRSTRAPRKTGVPCPRPGCGGELVKRRGRTDTFYGCSRFPLCTHTARELPKGEQESPSG